MRSAQSAVETTSATHSVGTQFSGRKPLRGERPSGVLLTPSKILCQSPAQRIHPVNVTLIFLLTLPQSQPTHPHALSPAPIQKQIDTEIRDARTHFGKSDVWPGMDDMERAEAGWHRDEYIRRVIQIHSRWGVVGGIDETIEACNRHWGFTWEASGSLTDRYLRAMQ
jgi:hypothetical protein